MAGAVNEAVGTARENVSTGLRHANEALAGSSDEAPDAVKKHPVRTALLTAIGVAVAGRVHRRRCHLKASPRPAGVGLTSPLSVAVRFSR